MEKLGQFRSLSFLELSFVFLIFFQNFPVTFYAQISSVNDALSAIRDGEEDTPQIPHIYFSITSANGTSDECVLAFFDDATSNYEWTYDALKIESFNPAAIEMALVTTDANHLTVDARPFEMTGFEVPIYLDIPAAGSYTFTIGDAVNLPIGTCIYVEDLLTGNTIPAESGQTLVIYSNASYSGNRLLLRASATPGITTQNITCENLSGGIIDVIIPAPGLSFSLSFGETILSATSNQSQTFTELTAGNYLLELYYSDNHCSASSQSVIITEPQTISARLTWQRVDLCNTAQNGAVLIENISDTILNYSIINSAGTMVSSGTLPPGPTLVQNLSGDTYQIITDGDCPLNTLVNLSDPEAIPAVGYDVIPATCGDLNNGKVIVFDADSEFSFQLLDSLGQTIFSGVPGDIITQLSPGNYSLHVYKPSLVCPAIEINLEVFQIESLSAALSNLQIVRCNDGSGGAFAISTNAVSGFDFNIINSDGITILSDYNNDHELLINSLVADIYTVEIITGCGSEILTADLTDPLFLETTILGGDVVINLTGGQSETLYIEHTGSTDNSEYFWRLSNGYESGESMFFYSFDTPGTYELILEHTNGYCSALDTIQILVNEITAIESPENQSQITFIQTSEDITFSFCGEPTEISGVSIVDISGKTVWGAILNSTGNRKITTSTAQLSAGTYIAVFHSSNKLIFRSKFVVR